jgi:predicted ATPase/class 3 adenylate cyclase/DNA-binding CsgD family transcriptional regulator
MATLPIGTVTFLFTDVEGSTRLWEQHPQTMRTVLARHDALIEAAVAQHAGAVVRPRGEGDSRFAVFPRASAAVTAAGTLQQALWAEPWPAETPLRVRLALHTGEADVRAGDYYGSAVNRCARLRAIAHGGQTLLSQATHDLVRDALPVGILVRELGEHRLADLQRAEQVYQLLAEGLPADFPPLRSLDASPNNLPLQPTSFVGRETEIAAVTQALATTRLLTLTGAGGAGKTRLALQIAADLVATYPDGVWFVDLGPLADPALVAVTVAAVVGVRDTRERPAQEALVGVLRARRVLLVLDNCEHLVAACARLVETLLRSCASLRVLTTSRERLGIPGEAVWHVPSLTVPDPRQLPSVEQLLGFESVRLFVERAQLVVPAFTVTTQNAHAVLQVCSRLDGIPLALELAAARARVLTVEQIATRLDDRFRLLTGGSRTALRRQQTLRTLVDWSHDLLSERERVLFRRLAVFAGGWALEAAEGVCFGDGIDQGDVLDLLTGLVDKSLVLAEEQGDEKRYRFLETIRHYAAEKLDEAGETARSRDCHRDWYVALAEQAEPELSGPAQIAWLDHLEATHDNLRAALEWSLETDPARGVLLAGCLWRFWGQRGFLEEGLRRLRQALDRVRGLPSFQTSNMATEDHVVVASGFAAHPHTARALVGAGLLADFQGASNEAMNLLQAGLALYRQMGDKRATALALRALGGCLLRYGTDSDQVKGILQESLDLARIVGDQRRIGGAIVSLGHLAARERDYASARALIEEGLALFQAVGDVRGVGTAQWALGWLALERQDLEEADQRFLEALSIAHRVANQQGIGFASVGLAAAARSRGDLGRSRQLLAESVQLFRDTGNPSIYETIGSLGDVAVQLGDYARGVQLMAAATTGPPQYGALSTLLDAVVSAGRQASTTTARSALGKVAFNEAWAAGQAMTLEQAFACVRAIEASPPSTAGDRSAPRRKAPVSPLTAREREVAALVARGLTNRQIAAVLVVTEGTAASHVEHIRGKLGFHARAQIAAWAIENKLVTSSAPS